MSQLTTVYHSETGEAWELQEVVARGLVAEGSFGYAPPAPKAIAKPVEAPVKSLVVPKPANVHRELEAAQKA